MSNEEILQRDHETVIGKIIYLSEKKDRQGEERALFGFQRHQPASLA